MDLTREHHNLSEYRAELEAAEARLQDAESDVLALTQIVAGLEARVARLDGGIKAEPSKPEERPAERPALQAAVADPPPRRKRRGLKKMLRVLMDDDETRDVDQVMAALALTNTFRDDLPKRSSVSN